MHKVIPGLALIVWSALSAVSAQDCDPMSAYYRNTWEFTAHDGVKRLHINVDHTFQMLHFNGHVYDGTWDRSGQNVCFHVGTDTSCFDDIAGRAIDTKWAGPHDGGTYSSIIRPGRVKLIPGAQPAQ